MPSSRLEAPAPVEIGPDGPASLAALNETVKKDLALLRLPPAEWTGRRKGPGGDELLDVLIIGAGMYGMAAAGSLILKGVRNIRLLDQAPYGAEGPWKTYARMPTLRSPKDLPGAPFGIPSLTFHSWYEARFGPAAWEALYKIPNGVWQDYLLWLREVFDLPVENSCEVVALEPQEDCVAAITRDGRRIEAKRLVVATGRAGAGGFNRPQGFAEDLWPDLAAHTCEEIDFDRLAGKRIAVVGAGSSAWDNAATALEQGAASVDMFCRRKALPQLNKGRANANPGFFEGWHSLSDAQRWDLAVYLERVQVPPPHETVMRTLAQDGFAIHLATPVKGARRSEDGVVLTLADGSEKTFDFLILGTGFKVDLAAEPLFAGLSGRILTWGEVYAAPADSQSPGLATQPYLEEGFELQERGSTPSAFNRIHIFNSASYLSFGTLSLDVPSLNPAGERLASHLCRRLFVEDFASIEQRLKDWEEEHELQPTPFYAPDYVNWVAS